MCKKTLRATALALLGLLLVVASPVLAYVYYASYVITEANGTDYDMLAVSGTSNNDWMADNDFMRSDAMDTHIQTLGGSVKPHMVAEDRTLTSVLVEGNSQVNLYFTTGDTPLSDMDIIVGYDGYVTITDHASLEMAADFEHELKGYIDTTATGDTDIFIKPSAYTLTISAAGSVKAAIYVNGWTTPTGHVDPDVRWTNAGNAYDDDTGTLANNQNIPATSWGNFLQLTHAAMEVDRIRYFAGGVDASITQIDLDVYYDGGWQDLFQGAFVHGVWETKTMTDVETVTQTRIRLYNSAGGNKDGYLYEVDFGEYTEDCTATATGISSGIRKINVDIDAGNLVVSVYDDDDVLLDDDTTALGGASVPNITTDYTLMSNATPYLEYFSYSTAVGGFSEKIDYDPDDMIVTTSYDGTADAGSDTDTIIDAELTQADDYWIGARVIITDAGGAAPEDEDSVCIAFADATDEVTVSPAFTAGVQAGDEYTIAFGTLVNENNPGTYDGRITWGVNPGGIAVTLGSMTSVSQPTGAVDEEPTEDILPATETSDWFVDPDVSGTLLTNPIRPFVTMLSDNSTLTELQSWRLLASAFVLLCTVSALFAVPEHLIITGIAAAASIGLAVSLTIYPFWTLAFAVMAVIGGAVSERSPTL